MRLSLLLAAMLVLAGCSGGSNDDSSSSTTSQECPDDAACTSPTTTSPSTTSTTTSGTTTPTSTNGTTDGNTTTPGAVPVDGETRLTFAFNGAQVHETLIVATAAFTLDDMNHVETGNGAPTSYGVALWSLTGPVLGATCSDGSGQLAWDARTHPAAIGWDEVPAGTYALWVWNGEGESVSIEFNGASTDTEARAVDAPAINWTATEIVPELTAPGPAQSTQTFSQVVAAPKGGLLFVEYAPPNGLPDASSSTTVTAAGTECAKATSEAASTPSFQGTTLRATAALGAGDALWEGEFSATTSAFGTFQGGDAVGLLLAPS